MINEKKECGFVDLKGGANMDLNYFENLVYKVLKEGRESEWLFKRAELVQEYSWSIPNEDLVREIAEYSPLVSIGAGTGYLEALVRQVGGDIIATEPKPKKEWIAMERLNHTEALEKYPERNILLSWPPYNSRMAAEVIEKMKSSTLFYIGELEGGCCGDKRFWKILEKKFEVVKYVGVYQWPYINDIGVVYKRK